MHCSGEKRNRSPVISIQEGTTNMLWAGRGTASTARKGRSISICRKPVINYHDFPGVRHSVATYRQARERTRILYPKNDELSWHICDKKRHECDEDSWWISTFTSLSDNDSSQLCHSGRDLGQSCNWRRCKCTYVTTFISFVKMFILNVPRKLPGVVIVFISPGA